MSRIAEWTLLKTRPEVCNVKQGILAEGNTRKRATDDK